MSDEREQIKRRLAEIERMRKWLDEFLKRIQPSQTLH
jgi:hypothetical protein